MNKTENWFAEARYGLFIHYGLYALLERGEWVWNREEIPLEEYKQLAARFTAKHFDADKLCRMAVDAGAMGDGQTDDTATACRSRTIPANFFKNQQHEVGSSRILGLRRCAPHRRGSFADGQMLVGKNNPTLKMNSIKTQP